MKNLLSSNCPIRESELLTTRRQLFGRSALGVGTAALAGLMNDDAQAGSGVLSATHHPATAKRVIYLFMSGGPSHLDLWDYKPKLVDMFNQQLPDSVRGGQRVTGMTANQKNGLPVCPSKYKFMKQANNDKGVWVRV